MNRRAFLKAVGGLAGGFFLDKLGALELLARTSPMPMRPLGKTGLDVSVLGLGGFNVSLDSLTDKTATDFMRFAIDQGINFFDNAREYNKGLAEERMGKALRDGYRDRVVLMTKLCDHERRYKGIMQSIEESLKALQTDHIDLALFHEVVYPDDPAWIFERGGIEAAIEARKQGKIRFIGFSGHKLPRLHLEMLNKPFKWDAVMLPLGIMDYHFRSFTRHVLPTLVRRNIGIIGFKTLGGFMSGSPQKAGVPVAECLRYSMSLPASTIVVGMETMDQLKENLHTAHTLKPMSRAEMDELRRRTAEVSKDGKLEAFKISPVYDGSRGRLANGLPPVN